MQNGIGSANYVTKPRNWNIPLQEIQKKITVWQAEEDCLTGKMAEYIAKRLPDCELIRIPNAGHLWIMKNIKRVLEKPIAETKIY